MRPLDTLVLGSLASGVGVALLVGAICAVVLVLKSIRDFTRTGPEMAEEVLKHYRLYLAYSLARLVVFTLLITAFMAFLGVVVEDDHRARLAEVFRGCSARFCLVSFDTDWLYPTSESRAIAHALNAAGAPVSFMELAAPYGHDSFLLDVPALDRVIEGFLLR